MWHSGLLITNWVLHYSYLGKMFMKLSLCDFFYLFVVFFFAFVFRNVHIPQNHLSIKNDECYEQMATFQMDKTAHEL